MPRYLVERSFPDGLSIPMTEAGARICQRVIKSNAAQGVTWIHSYVNPERTKTFCVYDAPTEDAIRRAAEQNELPVDVITEVSVLDPYFYRS
jgi:predicted amidohydrolase YtcJ